ncbi:uncharacterized protein VTP21DRAFT_8011 [Calcarisporiella thermophila]|uniref:uncharacterized protein n=1 Tax=Calcarisporiella thermophila TaxID=911321 RepID=UPI003741F1E3
MIKTPLNRLWRHGCVLNNLQCQALRSPFHPTSRTYASVTPSTSQSSTTTNPISQAPSSPNRPNKGVYHFDTHKLVAQLESSGFTRGQAIALMRAMDALLSEGVRVTESTLLQKADLENNSYLFKAALSELRTEIEILRRNDTALLRSELAIIERDISTQGQKLREDLGVLKHDIQLEMNNRKAESREEIKRQQLHVHEMNNKYSVSLGDIRTEIETVKWETTRRGLLLVFSTATGILLVSYLLNRLTPVTPPEEVPLPSTEVQLNNLGEPVFQDMEDKL